MSGLLTPFTLPSAYDVREAHEVGDPVSSSTLYHRHPPFLESEVSQRPNENKGTKLPVRELGSINIKVD